MLVERVSLPTSSMLQGRLVILLDIVVYESIAGILITHIGVIDILLLQVYRLPFLFNRICLLCFWFVSIGRSRRRFSNARANHHFYRIACTSCWKFLRIALKLPRVVSLFTWVGLNICYIMCTEEYLLSAIHHMKSYERMKFASNNFVDLIFFA